jgi:hypothetical protein
MVTSFTDSGQGLNIIDAFGGPGVDLHGATITARIMVVAAGNAKAIQMYTQDGANYASDYGGYMGLPAAGSFANLVYVVPAASTSNDTTKARQIVISLKSNASLDGGTPTPTTVWIDSITFTNAPPAPGGGTYSPIGFDTGILPFFDNGVVLDSNGSSAGIADTVSWIP